MKNPYNRETPNSRPNGGVDAIAAGVVFAINYYSKLIEAISDSTSETLALVKVTPSQRCLFAFQRAGIYKGIHKAKDAGESIDNFCGHHAGKIL